MVKVTLDKLVTFAPGWRETRLRASPRAPPGGAVEHNAVRRQPGHQEPDLGAGSLARVVLALLDVAVDVVGQAALRLFMAGLFNELEQLQQVINVFPAKRAGCAGQARMEQSVLTKRNQVHKNLTEILGLQAPKSAF